MEVEWEGACRGCRKVVFKSKELQKHDRETGKSFTGHKRSKEQANCTSYFLKEKPDWIESQIQASDSQEEGKIECPNPKCGAKLGAWKWSGLPCSCGCWFSPAFQISHSRIDVKK
eukprot:TRINITY_DN4524_c0_g1_i3.p1 TRINITY_DN4524_c0_g1~~TRINITY_DN4524_c0_g1_i3.p1  ORF type:complete len:115 (+),score=27.12 TRINITY_DN4524_c0_g1_i3:1-345(+)